MIPCKVSDNSVHVTHIDGIFGDELYTKDNQYEAPYVTFDRSVVHVINSKSCELLTTTIGRKKIVIRNSRSPVDIEALAKLFPLLPLCVRKLIISFVP